MGLVPQQEREHSDQALSWAKSIVKENLDLEKILKISAQKTSAGPAPFPDQTKDNHIKLKRAPRIGYILDRSFWFYYPENLHQLKEMGALLKRIDSISDQELPELDALYIGGGFPETQARSLADNTTFRLSLKKAIEKGLPVYAECGGLMYLGQSLLLDNNEYPMVGALPIKLVLKKKPQGHGYTILRTMRPNIYYPVGETIKGHEFHYSKAIVTSEEDITFAFSVERGHGVDGKRDGFCKNNLLATYTHIHAAGNRVWAKNFINAATCRGK
jgi:cobyrinic acid a,c-diamide synthase